MDARLSKRFEDALVYAAQLHASQTRKGTDIPYISHLMAVASLVIEAGGTEDEAIAALLHDGPEDQGGLPILKEIRDRFGESVGYIVSSCSDTFDQIKPAWHQRKQDYLDHLADADASVRLVSCADKLHNARAILADYRRHGEALWDRFNAGREDIVWYYSELARIFAERGPERLASELSLVVQQLKDEVGGKAA